MSRRVSFTLTSEQLAELEHAINYSPQAEVRQRAIAIRLLHLGYKPEQVAEIVAISATTIWTWHRRWRKEGLAGLEDRPKPGGQVDSDYLSQLDAALKAGPERLGLAGNRWTIDGLRLYLQQRTGFLVNYTRFRALLLSKYGDDWRQDRRALEEQQFIRALNKGAAAHLFSAASRTRRH